MGNVENLRKNINDFLYANTLNIGWLPHISGYPLIENSITNQIKNTENKQTIRLLNKRKFRNIEYI